MFTKRVINFIAGLLFVGIFCLNSGAFGYVPSGEAVLPSVKTWGHARMPSEVVFIDQSVRDAEIIVSQLPKGAEVIRLSPGMDGVTQFSAHLAKKRNLSAIRVISHGNAGYFVLNGKRIDRDFLRDHGDRISVWGQALVNDGDILLYACNLAETAEGEAFVEHLADLTGVDVAASTNVTGGLPATDHGSLTTSSGWDLEYNRGLIESIPLNVQRYTNHLADVEVANNNDTGAGSLRQAIVDVGDGETITFNISGSDTVTITSELSISGKGLTINGYNSATGNNVTVKVTTPGAGGTVARIFSIDATGKTINISNMTIQGGDISSEGHVAAGYGGGIYIIAGTLNLDTREHYLILNDIV